MAKWFGRIGFVETGETATDVWEGDITEKEYSGDTLKSRYRIQSTGNLNDDIIVVNEISIVADSFANENFRYMRWVEFMGAKWKITNVDVQYPRLILTIGDIYNDYE